MQYLTVRFSISGSSNGANVDFGTRSRDIEMTSDYDEQKIFEAIDQAIIKQEDDDK